MMKRLLPVLEILRDSALRLGGTDEEFITAIQGTSYCSGPVEPRRPTVRLDEVVANEYGI
jgi:hypothetical protein